MGGGGVGVEVVRGGGVVGRRIRWRKQHVLEE